MSHSIGNVPIDGAKYSIHFISYRAIIMHVCVIVHVSVHGWMCDQACSVAVVASVNSGLIKENPWNSSWSRFWMTSSSGGVSTGGWRVKKRSKFSASRPHCWRGWGLVGVYGEKGEGRDRPGWMDQGEEGRGRTKEGKWKVEPGCEMTTFECRFKYLNKEENFGGLNSIYSVCKSVPYECNMLH